MARMIPDFIDERTRSAAEHKLFHLLRDKLNDDYTVFHSFHINTKLETGQFMEGEIDFLVFSPKYGFLVLEVKGGGIRYEGDTGTWYQNDRPLKTSPFEQGSVARNKLRTWLSRRDFELSADYYSSAVCFPDVFAPMPGLPAGAEPWMCVTGRDIPEIDKRLQEVFNRSTKSGAVSLDRNTQARVRQALMPHCEFGTSLIDRIGQAEQQIFSLTENQCMLLDFLSGHRQALIEGCAGSGKTVMAIKKARELAGEGKSVLLLVYNQLIGEHIADSLAGLPLVTATTYHNYCLTRLMDAGLVVEVDGFNDRLFTVQIPEMFDEYLRKNPVKYDAVIIDEGQDFAFEYWVNISEMARPEGHFYIFYDSVQNIFGKDLQFPIKGEPFTLKTNCRNTRKIAGYMEQHAGKEVRMMKDAPAGEEVVSFSSPNPEARRKQVAHILHDLVNKQGLSPADIVILGGHSLAHTCLARDPHLGNFTVVEGQSTQPNTIKYYTYMKFKGCESMAVILLDVDPTDERWSKKGLYTSSSRAKQLLYVVDCE